MDNQTKKEVELISREVIEDSIEGHRNYLTQIFERLIWALGIIALIVIALFTFFVHGNYSDLKTSLTSDIKKIKENAEKDIEREVESKIIQYRIVNDLKLQLNELVKITVENRIAEDQTKKLIEHQIVSLTNSVFARAQEELLKSAEQRVQKSLGELTTDTSQEILQKVKLPIGAVLAFNRKECPVGWSELSKASGRVIVGSGTGLGLTTRVVGETGGEEGSLLSISNIPSHKHDTVLGTQPNYSIWGQGPSKRSVFGATDGVIGTGMTSPIGEGKAFGNMPPYLVLLYCQKDK